MALLLPLAKRHTNGCRLHKCLLLGGPGDWYHGHPRSHTKRYSKASPNARAPAGDRVAGEQSRGKRIGLALLCDGLFLISMIRFR